MDTLFLHGLKAETLIGVYDWERQQRQTLLLDVLGQLAAEKK